MHVEIPFVLIIATNVLRRSTVRLVDDSDPKIREGGSTTMAAIANASRQGFTRCLPRNHGRCLKAEKYGN